MEGFFDKVYSLVKEIPKGKVATYGQIAKMLNAPRFSQIVGFALHSNPDQKTIPCHRVVNREGRICSGFAFGGDEAQRKLLESEGVRVDKDGVVDLKKYLWNPETENNPMNDLML